MNHVKKASITAFPWVGGGTSSEENSLGVVGLGTNNNMFLRIRYVKWDADWTNLAPNLHFNSAPAALAAGKNNYGIFALREAGDMFCHWLDSNVNPSVKQLNLGGRFNSPPSVVKNPAGGIFVFGLDRNNQIVHKSVNPQFSDPEGSPWEKSLSGKEFSSVPCAVPLGSKTRIYGLASDNRIYENHLPNPSSWSSSGLEHGRGFGSPPTVVSPYPKGNRLDIFVLGEKNQMLHKGFDGEVFDPSSSWHDLGGVFSSPPAAAVPIRGSSGRRRLDVFALGKDNAIYYRYSYDSGKTWELQDKPFWSKLGTGVFSSPPVAVLRDDNKTVDIFALGTNNQMYIMSSDDDPFLATQTGWNSIGGVFSHP